MVAEVLTFNDVLIWRAKHQPEKQAYIFLRDGECDEFTLTYQELDSYARSVAEYLRQHAAIGDRALLLYPSGPDFIAAFVGCLYAGVIAVPTYPSTSNSNLKRLMAIVADCQPNVILSTSQVADRIKTRGWLDHLVTPIVCTDKLLSNASLDAPSLPGLSTDTCAFLQYTSGSTSMPKGVMVTHANILHNQRIIEQAFEHSERSVIVGWLPLYHDMGLIGGVLQSVYSGIPAVLFSPTQFAQKPIRWLQAISRFHATESGAPNFAYELCLRQVSAEEISTLDLSSWEVAYVAAEPIRAETLRRFIEKFAPCGFRPEAFQPAYGLAESTLLVTGGRKLTTSLTRRFSSDELQLRSWINGLEVDCIQGSQDLVGCGRPIGQRLIIVAADGREITTGDVGEIWVSGPSVAAGYWNNEEQTALTFKARLTDTGEGPFLRTGDLGCIRDGTLFITGRIKDLIIIHGRNYYPQDIEATAGNSHSELVVDRGAAFSVDVDGVEQLVVVQEVNRQVLNNKSVLSEMVAAIRSAVLKTHELAPYAVLLLVPHSIPLTSSGKIRRRQCKQDFLSGTLKICWEWRTEDEVRSDKVFFGPQTAVEEILCGLWCEVLEVERVGVHDDFFALGGQSLVAAQLMSQVCETFGVELPLNSLFEAPTIAALSALITECMLPELTSGTNDLPSLRPTPRTKEGFPLSFGQEGLWFLEQMELGRSFNAIPIVYLLKGSLNIMALERSFNEILRRHEVLRSTFVTLGGTVRQQVATHEYQALRVLDLSHIPDEEKQHYLQTLASRELANQFDLAKGPLLRFILARFSLFEHAIIVVVHHLVTDGASLTVFADELKVLYEVYSSDSPSPLAEPPIQYADFAYWQRQWTNSANLEKELAFWKTQIGSCLPMLELPTDRPRAQLRSFRGASKDLTIDSTLTHSLRGLSQREATSLFMTFVAAFDLLFSRYTEQENIVIGVSAANRTFAGTQNLIGCFVNVLPLRVDLSGNPSFSELLKRVKQVALQVYALQHIPIEKITEELPPDRTMLGTSLFDVVIDYLPTPQRSLELSGLSATEFELETSESKFPLTITIEEQNDALRVRVAYQRELFLDEHIAVILDQLKFLLEQVVEHPEQTIQSYSLVTPSSLVLLPDPRQPLPEPLVPLIPDLFAVWAERAPGRIAICQGQVCRTYDELHHSVVNIAQALLAQGLKRGDVVAVLGSASYGTIASMMAVLVSGGVLLSLDRSLPPQRHRLMMLEAQANYILCVGPVRDEDSWIHEIEPLLLRCVERDSGQLTTQDLEGDTINCTLPEIRPEDAAYIIFTTGTTSAPKGVLGCHKGLGHFLKWQRETFGVGPHDRFIHLTNFAFDMALRDVFLPLSSGSTLYLLEEVGDLGADKVLPLMEREGITILHIVPTLAQSWLVKVPQGISLRMLRCVFFAGEPLTDTLIQRWRRAFPGAGEIINLYGPTETTQSKCFFHVPTPPLSGIQPIGEPIPEAQILILSKDNRLCGIGESGEIVVQTPFRSLGYINAEEEGKKRFVKNPFRQDEHDLLYYSRDRGRYRYDGYIDILGRLDHQVKVRGIAVDPDEITTVLARYPSVKSCVVVAHKGEDNQSYLAAYVVPSSDLKLSIAELRSYLGTYFIAALIPTRFVFLDSLPTAPNGKVDRRLLPLAYEVHTESKHDIMPSRTPLEDLLSEFWCQVLNVDQISIHDNFFELGGHSLLATQLMARVREAFRVELPLRSLFERPTVAGLAAAIAEHQGKASSFTALPTITPDPKNRGEPFPLTDVQQAYWLGRSGIFELGAVAAHSYRELEVTDLDIARYTRAWQQLIERHDMLRMIVQPDGQQRILDPAQLPPFHIPTLDLRGKPAKEVYAQLETLREQLSHQVLPGDQWPLFSVRATLLDDRLTRLHFNLDALICDAWSRQVLLEELSQLYQNPERWLPPLEISFRDYVLAEQGLRQGEEYAQAEAYWKARLADLPPAPELPLLHNPAHINKPHFVRHSAKLEPTAWRQLKKYASQIAVTPSGVLLAAFAEILAAWSKSQRFTINLTLFNRLPLHPQVNELVGDFTSLTLLAIDYVGRESFADRARRIQEQLWIDLDHRAYSGVQVLREVNHLQGGGPHARMPIVFTSALTTPVPTRDIRAPHRMEDMIYGISQTPQVWLDHQVYEQGGALIFTWDALDAIFPTGLVEEMFAAYYHFLQQLAEDAAIWGTIEHCLTPQTQLDQRATVNSTSMPVPEMTLYELFASQVDQRRDQLAVIAHDRTLSYEELAFKATQVALLLRSRSVQPNTLVGVVLDKGWEQVVAVLGIIQAGAAYLPIETGVPEERLKYFLTQGEVRYVLTHSALEKRLSWPTDVQRLKIDELPEVSGAEELSAKEPRARPEDLAYVIYTSGSTGKPKGVMIEHRSAVNTILDINRRFGVCPADRVLAVSSLSFDLSVYDLFGILAAGGTIVMPSSTIGPDPDQWARLLWQEQVTIWNSVPALLGLLLDSANKPGEESLPTNLRLLLLSGDWIPLRLAERIRSRGRQVVSLGGATEAAIWSIFYPIEQVEPGWTSIPYGYPLANQQWEVYNQRLEPCPVWAVGQLYIRGSGLARGYWRDEERTQRSFMRHPQTGERLYATGDLGRYLPDGSIELLGREDFQIKIRGYRIELGEIEAALAQHPDIYECAVNVKSESEGEKSLVAYFTTRKGAGMKAEELRSFMGKRLPNYMVPLMYVQLDSLPLTGNGKIDRKKLPEPTESRVALETSYRAPKTELERTISGLWQEILGVDQVGTRTNFFDLGGDSLKMVQVHNKLRESTSSAISLVDLFKYPTVESLARHLSGLNSNASNPQRMNERAKKQKEALAQRKTTAGSRRKVQ